MSTTDPYAAPTTEELELQKPVHDPLDDVPSGSAAEILAWVGEDAERAELALKREEDGHQRKTVLKKLKELL
jgi:hypothetical protein